MILLITYTETNNRTGRKETLVSHGVNLKTDKAVVLPQETPQSMGARFDRDMGEWLLAA